MATDRLANGCPTGFISKRIRESNNGERQFVLADDGSVTLRDSSARVVSFGPRRRSAAQRFRPMGRRSTSAPLAGDARLRAFDIGRGVVLHRSQDRRMDARRLLGLAPDGPADAPRVLYARGKNFGVFTCQNAAGGGEDILIVNYDEGDHLRVPSHAISETAWGAICCGATRITTV